MLIKFAVQDFLEDKKYKNLSTKTIEGYKRSLNMFQEYCVKQEVLNVEDIRPMTIKSFLIHLEAEHGNNATSRNNKLRIVKNFMSWCQDNELISDKQNVAKKVNYAKEEIILKPFSDQQINQMLSYLRNNKQRERTFLSYRNYIIIVFLLGTGVRLGELISITWNDMDLKNGSASILGKKRELSSVPLTDKLIKEMAEYKVYCEQHFEDLCPYVFCTEKGTKLHEESVKTMFKKLKHIMNFKDVRLSCHTFRITFAVKCIQNGIDAFTLMRLLRHTDIAMTNRYVRMFGTALKSQNDKFNPLNDINL